MKKTFLFFAAIVISGLATAQSTSGLIAHWNMDSTVTDVSGHGHNGTMHNIVPDTGFDGIYGHAYYFNGSNSMITVPYSPALNVSKFTICAVLKVSGFYSGNCQVNSIFERGKTGGGSGTYSLTMGDNIHDNDCSNFDSTQDVFSVDVESRAYLGSMDYLPKVVANTWYRVVGVFNDTTYKLFVNGVMLDSTNLATAGVPIGTSTDSVCIGYDIFESAVGYPYPFNGVIDDIMLYNRPFSDSESVGFSSICGSITTQPVTVAYHAGSTVTYSISTSISTPTYQWQQDNGSGYTNLSNTGIYSGVFTPTLTITGVTSSIAGARYRCLVNNSRGCADTSSAAVLSTGTKVEGLSISENMTIFPNPTFGTFSIELPYIANTGSVEILNITGQVLQQEKINDTHTSINLSGYSAGMYILRIIANGETIFKKILKY